MKLKRIKNAIRMKGFDKTTSFILLAETGHPKNVNVPPYSGILATPQLATEYCLLLSVLTVLKPAF